MKTLINVVCFWAVLMAPALALGQASESAGVDIPWWAKAIFAALSLAGGYLYELARRWLDQQAKLAAQKTGLAFLARADDLAMAKVKELMQTSAEKFKAASADGKLSDAEKEELYKAARDWLHSLLDPKLWLSMFGTQENADKVISAIIEKNVVNAKLEAKIAENPPKP